MTWDRDCAFIMLSLEFSDLCFLLESSPFGSLSTSSPHHPRGSARLLKKKKDQVSLFFVLVFCVDLSFIFVLVGGGLLLFLFLFCCRPRILANGLA